MRHLSDVLLHLSRALDLNSHITTFLLCDFFDKCSNQDLAEECFLHLVSLSSAQAQQQHNNIAFTYVSFDDFEKCCNQDQDKALEKGPKKIFQPGRGEVFRAAQCIFWDFPS